MKTKITVLALGILIFTLSLSGQAQQTKDLRKIGYLSRELHPSDSRAPSPQNLKAFLQGLAELGYIEGKNLTIEYRYAEARLERLPALTEELLRLKVEIIVTDSTLSARAARKITSTVPIVFLSGSDPTQSGLAATLARPGGNVTGLTNLSGEMRGKRLELLREIVPSVTRFALLEGTGASAAADINIKATQVDAEKQRVNLRVVNVDADKPDFDTAFQIMVKERTGGLIVGAGSVITLTLNRKKILALVEQTRIPAIYPSREFINEGGLMYYGANSPDLFRRGATIVDRILKGAKPAEIPIERPAKFEFIVNLKAAKQIGLTIPPNVLARADRVIR